MHILFWTPGWPADAYSNGIVTYVHCMRQELMRRGHRVSVLAGEVARGCNDVDIFDVSGGKVARFGQRLKRRLLPKRPTPFGAGRVIAAAMAKIHQRDPIDIIEMEESFGWAADVLNVAGATLVVKLHGPAFLHLTDEELATRFGQEKVSQEGLSLAKLPFLTSPTLFTLRQTAQRYGLDPKIAEQVVNPILLSDKTPLWDAPNRDPDMLLFVGRFDKVKGGDLVILAFQLLLRSRPALKLVFVGPDPGLLKATGQRVSLRDFVASLDDAAVSAGLLYKGRLARADIENLRAKAAVTVISSRHENQAYTILEAMLQGCPIVSADNSGMTESVGDQITGLHMKSGDAADLALQIERLLADSKLCSQLGAAARRFALERHSPTTVVDQTLGVYERAISFTRMQTR